MEEEPFVSKRVNNLSADHELDLFLLSSPTTTF
jgi:hypothetical protein